MKKILLFLVIAMPVQAKHLHPEKYYQELWCNSHNGTLEYKLNDSTRVDCLLDDMAVEFDFAPKWAECIGQALYYGKKTNRKPVCVLIMEKPKTDYKYLYRLDYTVKDMDFYIQTIEP
jgi:hypothetical protein